MNKNLLKFDHVIPDICEICEHIDKQTLFASFRRQSTNIQHKISSTKYETYKTYRLKTRIINLELNRQTGASIVGGLGEQSPTFFKVGVDRLVILTDLLCLDRQIVA